MPMISIRESATAMIPVSGTFGSWGYWLKKKGAQPLIEDEESFMDQNKFFIFGIDDRVSKIKKKP